MSFIQMSVGQMSARLSMKCLSAKWFSSKRRGTFLSVQVCEKRNLKREREKDERDRKKDEGKR